MILSKILNINVLFICKINSIILKKKKYILKILMDKLIPLINEIHAIIFLNIMYF